MPTISVNNAPLEFEHGDNLSEVIAKAGFEGHQIAVAINGEFVPRAHYSNTQVSACDEVDIVKPIGGG
ncbi:MAG: sulfur carrier protein ThiS [Pseudomonadales bacterium]